MLVRNSRRLPMRQVARYFSTLDDIKKRVRPLTEPSVTGIGQVIFLPTVQSSAIVLGSLAIGNPYLAAMASAGALTSTAMAQQMELNGSSVQAGLASYNGSLVGCATAVFIAPESTLTALATTVAGASASTAVGAALGATLKMPQWTYAFNIVTLTLLLRVQPLAPPSSPASEPPVVEFAHLATAPLKGLSQIYVVESSLTGLGILVAIAQYSPMLAAHAILGSTVGCLYGAIVGAPSADIAAGLWGFNAALTSMGVGVFFVHNRPAMVASAAGAAATAGVFGALAEIFGAWHAPALTLPFCLTMSGVYSLAGVVPGLILAKAPHSPEKNKPYW